MSRIDRLTEKQVAQLAIYRNKWLARGLAVGPCDRPAMERAADEAYRCAEMKPPKLKIWLGSPFSGAIGAAILTSAQVGDQVGAQVGAQVWDHVEAQVGAQVGDQLKNAAFNSMSTQFEAGFAGYITFLRDVCGWTDPSLEKFEVFETLVKNCGWTWWHENVLAISDRPTIINRDDQGRLHCETGPSIAYRDGWGLHHWHGTAIPAEWITDRSKLTPSIALKCENVEQRRAACEILGWVNILRDLKAKTIDTDNDPEIGELVEVKLPDLVKKAKFLRVRCGTGREFAIGIPPHINKALDAQAWIVGLEPKDFTRPEIRA